MTMHIGIVGCGNISDIYLTNLARLPGVAVTAVADIDPEAARAKGARHGVPALPVDALLARDDVDTVLNLTIPAAHAAVSLAALEAGKHVYTEKPLATSVEDGVRILELAEARGLRVGAAPDTILGAGVETAAELIRSGVVGEIVTGTATVLGRGMEHWHPNPGFFFQPGGGPVLDMGPYYVAALVTLLGPVRTVRATARIGRRERLVTAEGPMKGRTVAVEVPTSVNAVYTFDSGAHVTFLASWDVWAHSHVPIELHGTAASLRVPDPNFFGGIVQVADEGGAWRDIDTASKPYGRPNWPAEDPTRANWRGLGLADMAAAIAEGRPHRANGALALHTLRVMMATLQAAETDRVIAL
ncbi:Gfo/Idh/MocA family protein [Chthonobacter rhizosphaerae]|uniref:Gfo/Idh/MocA family protein n=1 Tax=Chthonobacter rhizosphaerae TaxID=2735553 RepID=UPI0015EE4B88|nr:Gfo/Idh/MocA family oxidoreductase [Chthonobacter rhizosphaerae]